MFSPVTPGSTFFAGIRFIVYAAIVPASPFDDHQALALELLLHGGESLGKARDLVGQLEVGFLCVHRASECVKVRDDRALERIVAAFQQLVKLPHRRPFPAFATKAAGFFGIRFPSAVKIVLRWWLLDMALCRRAFNFSQAQKPFFYRALSIFISIVCPYIYSQFLRKFRNRNVSSKRLQLFAEIGIRLFFVHRSKKVLDNLS